MSRRSTLVPATSVINAKRMTAAGDLGVSNRLACKQRTQQPDGTTAATLETLKNMPTSGFLRPGPCCQTSHTDDVAISHHGDAVAER